MDPEYRKLIANNLTQISKSFRLTDKFWESLLYTGIFPKCYIQHMSQIKTETEEVKKKLLLIDLQRRSNSYGLFSNILKDVFNSNILDELSSANNDRYPFVSTFPGYCLILNNKEFAEDDARHGSENDITILCDLFRDLRFHVDTENNLTRSRVIEKLAHIRETIDWKLYDSFVFVIMSHGVSNHFVTSDSQQVAYDEVWQQFNDDNCPDLKNKPKIFIFNCCRPKRMSSPTIPITSGTCKASISDVFFMFSTLDNKYSVRDENSGTFFAKSLCSAITQNRNQDLSEISTRTNNILQSMIESQTHKLEKSQRVEYRTLGATKKFYFCPC